MADTKPWYLRDVGLESLKNILRLKHQERQRDHEYYLGVVSGILIVDGMDAHVSLHIQDFVNNFCYREAPINSVQLQSKLASQTISLSR